VLPGERRRERIILPKEEARLLAAAPEPLAGVIPETPTGTRTSTNESAMTCSETAFVH
jgi:hypothetical protein